MSLFKCKMCGGDLDIREGATIAECEYCGTTQTLPKLSDEKRINLYDRANHFRRNNDFDKAMSIYENILNEDNTDAEAYWSIVLCRYGIEYVEDPATKRRVPTINRAQYTSVFADEDYKSALANADTYQKSIYESEAKAIDEIQKGILAISQKEEPFDVFICYKETDVNGRRTHDSVLAQELYDGLTKEGFKVFFSRITLEDKLGTAYEPYIFAALNSAKVMVVLGTKIEHFNAVWVKNEWSRYLSLIKQGNKKTLIPAYKDIDPYDLPDEFSHLQAQDMSKLGFMQDLIRGIKKIVGEGKKAASASSSESKAAAVGGVDTASLLKRAYFFLEYGEFENADEYAEKILDINLEFTEAYIIKLMVEYRIKYKSDFANIKTPIAESINYKKAMRIANAEEKALLEGYNNAIIERNEAARKEEIYSRGIELMKSYKYDEAVTSFESVLNYKDSVQKIEECKKEKESRRLENIYLNAKQLSSVNRFESAIELFKSIEGYKDSKKLIDKCYENAEIIRKDDIFSSAMKKMNSSNTVEALNDAISLFKQIPNWKNSEEKIKLCEKKIEEIKAKAEQEAKAKKKRIICMSVLVSFLALIIVLGMIFIPKIIASRYIADGEYAKAIKVGNLTEFTIPDGVMQIKSEAFRDCTELKSVTIPNSVTSIGDLAFFECTNLTSITIPNSVTSIGDSAFSQCSNLASITIPNSVTSIGDSAFFKCSNLTSITIPNSVTRIGESAFSLCYNLTSITIPNSVTSIGEGAFFECSNLTSITIPNSVTSIGVRAFSNCKNLTSITIPNSVKIIGDYAFSSCENLTSITIPNSVIIIGDSAFYACSKLKKIYCFSNFDNINGRKYIPPTAIKLYYSESEPTTADGKRYWHYVDGVPTEWKLN